jgi:serine/threonine-protein kinase
MRTGRDTFDRFGVRRTGAIGAHVVPLLVAAVACGTSAPPQAAGPIAAFTMPPEWTQTPGSPAVSVPGWTTFTGNGVELMLPPSYEGGDPTALAQGLVDLLDDVPEYASIAEAIRQSPTGYRVLTMDRSNDSIVAVTVRDVPAELSMAEYVDAIGAAIVEQVPGTSIIQKGVIPFRDGEASWLLLEFTSGDAVSWQLSYGVRQGAQLWNFNYGAAREDYPQLQPIFDQSLQTVQLLP